jgi:DNA-binding transcriptional ArsR family regulator
MRSLNGPKRKHGGQPFAYPGLDRIIHERARLSVLTSLVAHTRGLPFNQLKQLCGLTDGNLSQHLRVLESARLVELVKGYGASRPQTLCRISIEGRRRYLEYLAVLEQVLMDAAAAVKLRGARSKRGAAPA